VKILTTFLCLSALPLAAQERALTSPTKVPIAPVPSEGTDVGEAKIIGELPDGSAPVEEAPAPKLVIETKDIVSTRTVKVGDARIVIQKVTPVALPPVEEPVTGEIKPLLQSTETNTLLTRGEVTTSDQNLRRVRLPKAAPTPPLLFIGATVYQTSAQPDRALTLVRYCPTPDAAPITFWSSANWNYLTGFSTFADSKGTPYNLLLAASSVDVADLKGVSAGTTHSVPAFKRGAPASFVIVEGSASEEDLAPIRALHELYNGDLETLKTAYAGRKQAVEAEAARRAANPDSDKNIVLKYWRVDRAGQKGITPKPADIR
jgi:hypothetical protein